MNPLSRWIVIAPLATVTAALSPVWAFTDSNAELKEAAADRSARVVVTGKAARPTQTVWVPVSAKQLDGFKPVLPPQPQQARLARAELPAQAALLVRR